MNYGEYIWQSPHWPNWSYNLDALAELLVSVSRAQGVLYGRLVDIGLPLQEQASLTALTEEVVQTSAIEGESLDTFSVRSSLARHLGVDIGAIAPLNRHVEGIVEMILDATQNAKEPITSERFFAWHASLFPTGYSGMHPIKVAKWRDDSTGPMQVVSGPITRQRVHFQAPPATQIPTEIDKLLHWLESKNKEPALLKAGIAHLWFVTLHPFDDGNGRIARAISDLLLARADQSPLRFYSFSAQIQRERKSYYEILEQTQRGDLDITIWLHWFLTNLHEAIIQAQNTLDLVLRKARFWQQFASTPINERQIKILNRLLDGFEGKLTTSKWAKLAKCSSDTALRDINELVNLGILNKSPDGGRSTHYSLAI